MPHSPLTTLSLELIKLAAAGQPSGAQQHLMNAWTSRLKSDPPFKAFAWPDVVGGPGGIPKPADIGGPLDFGGHSGKIKADPAVYARAMNIAKMITGGHPVLDGTPRGMNVSPLGDMGGGSKPLPTLSDFKPRALQSAQNPVR